MKKSLNSLLITVLLGTMACPVTALADGVFSAKEPYASAVSIAQEPGKGTEEASFTAFVGPGEGLPAATGATVLIGNEPGSGSGTGSGSFAIEGFYVKPSYWRGDVYCARSCVQAADGSWVYNETTAWDPTQDTLYKVKREEDGWYVCEYFGGEIWLDKTQSTPVTNLNIDVQNEKRAAILRTAIAQLGKPYQYGAMGPDSFDCSGFVNYCYNAAGLSVPRSSGEIGGLSNISYDELKPGDIVWKPGHVGIYVGNGEYIHSENSGTGVIMGKLPRERYSGFINVIGD